MRTFAQIIVLALIAIQAYGQSDFRPGYIIKNDGSRIEGEVDFRSNDLRYIFCRFKNDERVVEYLPNEVKGYGLIEEDRYFTSQLIEDTFVEFLIDGYVSLFRHDLKFYVQKENQPIDTLKSIIVDKTINGSKVKADVGGWKQLMKEITADCSDPKINNLKYLREQSLIRILVKYHECQTKPYREYKKNLKFTEIKPTFAFGISYNTINKKTTSGFTHVPDKFDKFNGWVGAYIQIGTPRLIENAKFQIGAEYHKNTYLGGVLFETGVTRFYETQIELSTISTSANAMCLMSLAGELKLNLQAGLNFEFHDGDMSTTEERAVGQNVLLSEFDSFLINKNQIGYSLGLGLRFTNKLAEFGLTLTTTQFRNLNRTPELVLINSRTSLIFSITL